MSFIRRDAKAGNQERLAKNVSGAEAWVDAAIGTTRQLTVDLSPPVLKTEGLVDALGWLVMQMKEMHNLDVVVEAAHAFYTPDEDLRVLLFQILRELLFNVVKHAGVDRVTIELQDVDDHLAIRVIDEGRGFDVEAAAARVEQDGGFGLFSVRERLNLIGGHMEIDSAPGAGTRITVHAPCEGEKGEGRRREERERERRRRKGERRSGRVGEPANYERPTPNSIGVSVGGLERLARVAVLGERLTVERHPGVAFQVVALLGNAEVEADGVGPLSHKMEKHERARHAKILAKDPAQQAAREPGQALRRKPSGRARTSDVEKAHQPGQRNRPLKYRQRADHRRHLHEQKRLAWAERPEVRQGGRPGGRFVW